MFKKLMSIGVCALFVMAVAAGPSVAAASSGGSGVVASVLSQDQSGGMMEGEKESMEGEGMMESTPGVPMTGALGQEQSGGMMESEKEDTMQSEGTMMEGDKGMMSGNLPATGAGDTTAWFLLAGLAAFLLASGAALRLSHTRR